MAAWVLDANLKVLRAVIFFTTADVYGCVDMKWSVSSVDVYGRVDECRLTTREIGMVNAGWQRVRLAWWMQADSAEKKLRLYRAIWNTTI